MFYTTKILNEVFEVITTKYSSGRTNYQLYINSFHIIDKKCKMFNDFNFELLVEWFTANKSDFGKKQSSNIQRCLYLIDDFIRHGAITQKDYRSSYHCSSSYWLDSENYSLVYEYVDSLDVSMVTKKNKIRYVSRFLNYLQSNKISINQLSHDKLYNYYHHEKAILTTKSFTLQCVDSKLFTEYLWEKKRISNYSLSYLLNPFYINDFEAILLIYLKVKNVFDSITDKALDIDTNDNQLLKQFESQLFNDNLSKSARTAYLHAVKYYYIFLDYTGYHHSYRLLEKWIELIVRSNRKAYKSIQTGVKKYFDFISTKIEITNLSHLRKNKRVDNLPSWSNFYFDKFMMYRKQLGYQESTLCMDRNSIFRFITFLDGNGIKNYCDITPLDVTRFHNEDEHSTYQGKNAYNCRIRNFLLYLSDEGVVPYKLILSLPPSTGDNIKVPSIINDDIIEKIYSSSHLFTSALELRSYAMVLVGIQLGLRSIDIINIKFLDISFENRTIDIFQIKTQQYLQLPLPIQCANAIYLYVKTGRFDSSNENVFIKTRSPYGSIKRHRVSAALNTVFTTINVDNESHGAHILRRTFATNILKKGSQIDMVSSALGHSSNVTIHKYLNLDDKRMKMCSLSMQGIEYSGELYE